MVIQTSTIGFANNSMNIHQFRGKGSMTVQDHRYHSPELLGLVVRIVVLVVTCCRSIKAAAAAQAFVALQQ